MGERVKLEALLAARSILRAAQWLEKRLSGKRPA
jgi:hypothetical protein